MGRWTSAALAFAVLLALPPAAQGQEGSGGIAGRVVAGDTGDPLGSASVAVRSAADSAVAAEGVTNEQGRFLVEGLEPGRYYLQVVHLGYGANSADEITVDAGRVSDAGTLRMVVEALEVDAILVTAERPVVTFEADRTAYDVGAMPMAEGGTASEVLAMMPELEVDIDGNVSLRGATPAIYVDGRPAPMSGEALAIFLEQFPADHIERIEVIDNPSARYDAEGSGGIINIVLREGVELGLSGSVFVNGGTRGQLGAGARGTWQRGRWTLDGGGSLRHTDRETSSFDLRQNLLVEPTTFRRQDASSSRSGMAGRFDLEAEFEVSERLQVFAEVQVDRNADDSDGLTTTTHLDQFENPTLRYDRVSAADSRNTSAEIATGLSYEWGDDHELEIELEMEEGRDDEETAEEVTAEDVFEEAERLPAELTLEEEGEREREASLDVDYVRPWGEDGRIEIGYQADLEETNSDLWLLLAEDGSAPGGSEIRRGFDHRQTFNSGYLTLQRELGRVGVQVGVRAERTDSRFEIPTGDVFRNDYYNLFPSANVSWRMDENRRLRLSYSRRIRRPSARVLNPIDRSTDPLDRRIGNPDLEPQFSHSVSMNASWSLPTGSLRLSPYYRRTENDWAEITSVDDDGVFTRTWDNVASQESYGASVTYSLRRGGGWGGYVSVSGRRQVRNASNLSDDYSGASMRWSTRANLSAPITEALSAQGTFSYWPAADLPQGRSSSRVRSDVGLRYRLLGERASLRLSLRDPFGLQSSSFETRDPSHVQIGRSEQSTRSARISFSYAFGGGGDDRGRRGRR